jgi:asparagine synthase (glutamine-hydrolysing)
MCGIAGILNLKLDQVPQLDLRLAAMNRLQSHRGPDDEGLWKHQKNHAGFAHRRLKILDLHTGHQPMTDEAGNWVVHNGEIYNYVELRKELGEAKFQTTSDTEVILAAYRQWGTGCVNRFRGMFAFAIWDERRQQLFCARDRFGIKPFNYTLVGDTFYFASEVKALLPFVNAIETDLQGFKDYLAFQFCLDGKTLFRHVLELPPGHTLRVKDGEIEINRYWQVYYDLEFGRSPQYFEERLRELLSESVALHLRADVPVGTYLSGGLDSSTIAALASEQTNGSFAGFTGKFSFSEDYDESAYARALAEWSGFSLFEIDITADNFIHNLPKVIYHLDFPVAGPGSFSQFMVSQLAATHRKVVLGGQGGDEIFGGYTRYLIAYFEQCIKGAIEGTLNNGNFIVTYQSIIPNLTALQGYEPLLQDFWSEGLFGEMDQRYFRLINRAGSLRDEIRWNLLGDYSPFETFQSIFNGSNVGKESYFDKMTHFDFKTLLPALLQVEDRVSMAHGLESRVPFLDHPLVEFAATMPAAIKFKDGEMKQILRSTARSILPDSIISRKDKKGFPTPLTEWVQGEAHDFVRDIFSSSSAQRRDLINNRVVLDTLAKERKFGRTVWGLLSLELWQREFHDRAAEFRRMGIDSQR